VNTETLDARWVAIGPNTSHRYRCPAVEDGLYSNSRGFADLPRVTFLRFSELFLNETSLLLKLQASRMATKGNTTCNSNAPSVKDRIEALQNHGDLFEMIDDFPQACINERFGKESALVLAYVESKVHRVARAAKSFIRENMQPGKGIEDENELCVQYEKKMDELVDVWLLHGMYFQLMMESVLVNQGERSGCRKLQEDELGPIAFEDLHAEVPCL
jgi:hypothetical protein